MLGGSNLTPRTDPHIHTNHAWMAPASDRCQLALLIVYSVCYMIQPKTWVHAQMLATWRADMVGLDAVLPPLTALCTISPLVRALRPVAFSRPAAARRGYCLLAGARRRVGGS